MSIICQQYTYIYPYTGYILLYIAKNYKESYKYIFSQYCLYVIHALEIHPIIVNMLLLHTFRKINLLLSGFDI